MVSAEHCSCTLTRMTSLDEVRYINGAEMKGSNMLNETFS